MAGLGCFGPPFCKPAQHVLGCFSLRQGASAVLALDGFYGLGMVVLHAVLLGQRGGPQADPGDTFGEVIEAGAEASRRSRGAVHWQLQLADLDIGWSHRLLGVGDEANLVGGLLFGIVIVVACAYVLHVMQYGGMSLPTVSRYFVTFLNLQICAFVLVSLVKLPKMCTIQESFLPALQMECDLLRFVFLERAAVVLAVMSVCAWVFTSFTYVLTFGQHSYAAVDRPEYALHLEDGPGQSLAPDPARHGLVGAFVAVQPPPRGALRPQSSHLLTPMGHPLGNYSHVSRMPRAASSALTSAQSHHTETKALLKPPIAVF